MRSSKARDSATGIRRARMFVQRDLSWMVGFPVAAGEWLSLSLGQPISKRPLDRELLHRSTLATRKLVRNFPRALPRLVGDTESWAGRRMALLETLKPAVHRRGPLPAEPLAHHPDAGESLLRLARRARRDAPRLERLVTALSWLCWTEPASLRRALRWLLAHQPALEALQGTPAGELSLAVRLWQLRHAHGGRRVAPCFDWLSRPGLFAHPMECSSRFGHQTAAFFERTRKRPPPKPEPRLGTGLIAWVEKVARGDAATGKRALELLPLFLDPDWQADWQRWWQRAETARDRARAIHRTPAHQRPLKRRQQRARGKLRKLDEDRPPNVATRAALEVLAELPSTDHLDLYRAIVPGLRRWPRLLDGAAVRLAFASHWLNLARQRDPSDQPAVRRLARKLCVYWRTEHFRPEVLEPWRRVWPRSSSRHFYFHLDEMLLTDLRESDKEKTFFEVLQNAREPVTETEAELLANLVEKLPAGRLEDVFSRLRDSLLGSDYLDNDLTALAVRLTTSDEDRFLSVLRVLSKHQPRQPLAVANLGPVADALDAIGRRRTVSRCIEAGHISLLLAVSDQLRFVAGLGPDPPGPDLQPAEASDVWPERYPSRLRPALGELARCDDRAERTAGRLLRKDFPDPAALRREIEALRSEESLDHTRATRLCNLEARLQAEPRVSPGRQATLEAKILTSAARCLVERWSRALSRAYDDALRRFLGVAALPPWSERDDVRRLLLAVSKLEPAFRQLARRLFRSRCGSPPWDLREDPANAAFLSRMSDLGIDTEPWVDSRPSVWVEDAQGAKIQLALERDPLETLQMGDHFRTCLATGSFNFFSAVANACDLNKQVLYGRDAGGVVVARMLMALTAEGGLLCFHPYARTDEIGFDRIAREYARQLAEAMGTLVVPKGDVLRLVATDWWDDGPTDPAEQHPALKKGSELRRTLEKIPPERLPAAIGEAFAPLACNELTLPLVLQLPELDARPELAYGATRLAEQLELPTHALLRLGQLLLEAGDLERGRALAPRLMARAVAGFREQKHDQIEVLELLVELDPSRALRVLRQTRWRGVRRWEQEDELHRLFLGARASRQLGRRKQARKLLEIARRAAPNKMIRVECDRLLAELD